MYRKLLHHTRQTSFISIRQYKSHFRKKCISGCLFTCLVFSVSLAQLLTGCSNPKSNDTPLNSSSNTYRQKPTILFPLQEEGGYHDAEIRGKLVLINNCLYLEEVSTDQKYLLIWPHNFSYRVKDEKIQVLNSYNEVLVEEGQHIRVSGGEYPTTVIPDSIPSDSYCTGPYWGVGLEVELNTDK